MCVIVTCHGQLDWICNDQGSSEEHPLLSERVLQETTEPGWEDTFWMWVASPHGLSGSQTEERWGKEKASSACVLPLSSVPSPALLPFLLLALPTAWLFMLTSLCFLFLLLLLLFLFFFFFVFSSSSPSSSSSSSSSPPPPLFFFWTQGLHM